MDLDTTRDLLHGSMVFRLHAGHVCFQGRICVPLRILDDVISGVHTYAHPGVYKTHQWFNRRYIVHEVLGGAVRKLQYHALYKRIQSVVSHCQVCQAVKGRKGVQPDTMTHYPIPEYPLSSVAMDLCHLPTVSRSKVEYDSVLVVVCRLTGYVRAIPCNERMTSEQLASLFLEQVVSFFGLPKEIFSDNDKIIDASFFSTFCKLSGIEEYRSPVYRARSNGRAERAVQVVIDSLRKFLEQVSAQKVKHKHTWLNLLPLAIWSANNLPGPISGYSPHRLLFGRDPVGFGEHPPLVADHGSEDALQFFRRVESEQNYVRTKLTQIHAKLTAAFNKAHPTRVFQLGERVWIRVNRQPGSGSKLDRLWVGPAEILQQISDGQYRVAGPY